MNIVATVFRLAMKTNEDLYCYHLSRKVEWPSLHNCAITTQKASELLMNIVRDVCQLSVTTKYGLVNRDHNALVSSM